ncbi:DUF58 domain-containing protein [Microbacterium sp. cx-55]|uniref:DUF58 domain-containing protein n=1 Tax=Microbacterium sp. cx-55 TaxID=2875948 RepID=UPI001CC02D55|nr:DUF58 domain-containing protein [Microbacterium sp. cx-55]MBZ4488739.1 DUF58 domain-containing protein [Microbacterium sp. cx-55]UGB36026.1 DUF58 domain-containing protein [Microbacterium sp. cx-55]
MYITGRLALLVAAGIVPVVLFGAALGPWIVAGGWILLSAAVAVADALLAASPRALRVAREIPARARRDEAVRTEVILRNTGTRRIHGRMRDAWQPTAGAPLGRFRIDIPGGESRRITVPLHPRRRGQLVSEFVVVRSGGPFGVAGRQASIGARGALRVLPPFRSRRHLPSRLARLRELDGSTSVQLRGRGTEFDSLREYVRGDDVRSIDWRATARAGTTMLRTWRPERDRHIVIVIDTGRTSATRVGDGVRLDAAMEATLLLSALAARAGDHVHLVMMDRVTRARVSGVDGNALVPALVDAMAAVDPQLIDTDWSSVAALVRRLPVRPALVVLLTAQDDPAASRAFLAALPSWTARSRVLVGAATDHDTSAGAADAAEGLIDAESAYLEAARARAGSDAARVADAVARAGAVSLAADAESLPPLIADHYLALKLRGLL